MRMDKRKTGFTLIELLVVIAIISMLVGLVSVGLRKTSIIAKNLRQKSVFHGMEIGLELFAKDFDGYPDSGLRNDNGDPIIGAQHFAEALVGRDGKGFDPATDWYAPDPPADPVPYTTNEASLKRRKPLYLEFKHFEARLLDDIYTNTGTLFTESATQQAPILTDVFERNWETGKRTGSPILYFKADRSKKEWDFRSDVRDRGGLIDVDPDAANWDQNVYSKWVYNLNDNRPLLDLGPANADRSDYERHYPDTDPADPEIQMAGAFYRYITNEKAAAGSTNSYRSFNPNTFLLISAGWDGVYGTKDDVTNFNY